MLNKLKDKELIAEFLKGDERCYIEIVERYTEKVFNLAYRFTRNQQDAEEVLQDVFITIYNKLEKFEGKSAFSSWLYRITVNTALMMLRKKKQTPTVCIDDLAPQVTDDWSATSSSSNTIDYMTTRHELRAVLEAAIAELPAEYKTIFLLRDVDGLSNQEVGEILELSVPAVKSRLHRARLMLRKKLSKYYEDYHREDVISFGPKAEQFLQAA